jgi:aryl-alcohol dehydrogenase-like predicted oxidoreductase
MDLLPLGANGPLVSRIIFGAWPIGGGLGAVERRAAIATVRHALEAGINAIDTAEYYRDSESILGEALAGYPREKVFLATKVSAEPFTRARIQEALDNSLRALRTDYVDLYQLHRYPSGVPLEESLEAIVEAVVDGKVRYIGTSAFSAEQLARCADYLIQSEQPRLNILYPEALVDPIPYCASHRIGVIVHSPLGKGLLTGRYRPGHQFAPDDERSGFERFQGETFTRQIAKADRITEIAREKGASLVQIAIAWTLAQPGVTSAIVGAKSPEQVDEQLGALNVRLTADDLRRIDEIAARGQGAA